MTIPIESLDLKVLKQLLLNPDISEMELDLIMQVCIQIISGNKTVESLVKVFSNHNNNPHRIDNYKVIKHLVENK